MTPRQRLRVGKRFLRPAQGTSAPLAPPTAAWRPAIQDGSDTCRAVHARKSAARLDARAVRKAIPPLEREQRSAHVRERVLFLPEVRDARTVGCYISVHSEVETHVLLQDLLGLGKRVVVPVVEPPERIEFAEVASFDDLVVGAHGIPEPRPPHRLVEPADVDVLLIPGLRFTPEGHRLGNGGGYFDRLLARSARALRVGLAYEAQVVDELPFEAHDERLDVVVTEKRVVRTGAR